MEGANNLNSYKNIKSITILKRIFENISQKTFLKLIKCNKKIQEALNIGINNYITYYYKIELEIIPIYKKEENIFINYDKNKNLFIIYILIMKILKKIEIILLKMIMLQKLK